MKYNDGLQPGGRRPRLYLVKGDLAMKFRGSSIPGICQVINTQYKQNGKWSNTTYDLDLMPGVRSIYFLAPLHGTWGEEFKSWGEAIADLQLSIETSKRIVKTEYPAVWSRLEETERYFLEKEKLGKEGEVVVISFGSPTNRAIRNGYWESDKGGVSSTGVEVLIRRDAERGWNNPILVKPEDGKILNVEWSPGVHGGYYKVEVAI